MGSAVRTLRFTPTLGRGGVRVKRALPPCTAVPHPGGLPESSRGSERQRRPPEKRQKAICTPEAGGVPERETTSAESNGFQSKIPQSECSPSGFSTNSTGPWQQAHGSGETALMAQTLQ